jgi:hypothetical protein
MWGVVGLGAVLCALPVAPLATYVYAAATGSNINKYKPLGLLLWEAGRVNGPSLGAIATELEDRMIDQSLDADQIAAVVERALALQADTKRTWSEKWGSVIEWAELNGHLSEEQKKQFLRNAPVLELEAPAGAGRGSAADDCQREGEPGGAGN